MCFRSKQVVVLVLWKLFSVVLFVNCGFNNASGLQMKMWKDCRVCAPYQLMWQNNCFRGRQRLLRSRRANFLLRIVSGIVIAGIKSVEFRWISSVCHENLCGDLRISFGILRQRWRQRNPNRILRTFFAIKRDELSYQLCIYKRTLREPPKLCYQKLAVT